MRVPGIRNNCTFKVIKERVFLCASTFIPKDTEVFVAYGHDYWCDSADNASDSHIVRYMTPEQYNAEVTEIKSVECKRDLTYGPE